MWRELLATARQLFNLQQEVQRLRSDLGKLQNEMEELRGDFTQTSENVRDIAHGLLQLEKTERLERENALLRLDKELLLFERRLPPGNQP